MARRHPKQHDSFPETEEPTNGTSEIQSTQQRPIWQIVADIGAEIPEELWATVPEDGSINYKHYLYGDPKKEA